MKVMLENGKTFEVKADKVSEQKPLCQVGQVEWQALYERVHYSAGHYGWWYADVRNDLFS